MANGRNRAAKGDSGRDAGGFVALPWQVLDCPAYASLSHPARALLLEVARQFHKDDNGRMLLTRAHLATRGWLSAAVIQKAKQELIDTGFIFETVKGQRPHRASWYAVTWRALDRIPGYDVGAMATFQRGAYRLTPGKDKRTAPKCKKPQKIPSPSDGTGKALIAPPHGTENPAPVPPHGAIEGVLGGASVPSNGIPLEMPSVVFGNPARIPATLTTMGRMLRCARPANRSTGYHAARANFAHLNQS